MPDSRDEIRPGEVLTYMRMCSAEGYSLQRGMNFRVGGRPSVLLMSRRPNAPYADRVEDGGATIVYEGHDAPKGSVPGDPKRCDQPLTTPAGKPTQNGLFFAAAKAFKSGQTGPDRVRIYEKVRDGVWVFAGVFDLVDAWTEHADGRIVCKFRLSIDEQAAAEAQTPAAEIAHNRMIPTEVKVQVWQRDQGRCRSCGSADNLHFDHIIPFSKGGTSLTADNIQLLCARHNLEKRANIQ